MWKELSIDLSNYYLLDETEDTMLFVLNEGKFKLHKDTYEYFMQEGNLEQAKIHLELMRESTDIPPPNTTMQPNSPPPALLFRRRAIRTFPNHQQVALYYCDRVGKYISIPYSGNFSGTDKEVPITESMDAEKTRIKNTLMQRYKQLKKVGNHERAEKIFSIISDENALEKMKKYVHDRFDGNYDNWEKAVEKQSVNESKESDDRWRDVYMDRYKYHHSQVQRGRSDRPDVPLSKHKALRDFYHKILTNSDEFDRHVDSHSKNYLPHEYKNEMEHRFGPLNLKESTLTEISKKNLKDYAKKAFRDHSRIHADIERDTIDPDYEIENDDDYDFGNYEFDTPEEKRERIYSRRANRRRFINKAIDRLSSEPKKNLKKSLPNFGAGWFVTNKHGGKVSGTRHDTESDAYDELHKIHGSNPDYDVKRLLPESINEAVKKIKKKISIKKKTKKIVEISNLQKLREIANKKNSGMLKFSDGSSILVSSDQAKAILSVHGKLSPDNQIKHEKLINKNKYNFQKASSFASGYFTKTETPEDKKKKKPAGRNK